MTRTSRFILCATLCWSLAACGKSDTSVSPQDMNVAVDMLREDASPDLDATPDLRELVPDLAEDLNDFDASEPFDMADAAPDLPDSQDMMAEDMALPPLDLEPLRAAIEQDISRNNATAASVSIWHRGQIIWVGGFGQTAEGKVPDEQTQFMIGSDTKKIASLAYLKQVERGLATTETTIGSQLPTLQMPYAANYKDATAHALMSNQGGLSDHTGQFSTQAMDEELRSYVLEQLPNVAYELAPPGVFYNYSNPSFSMLGLMTEQITAKYWADVVHDDLFVPLGMTRTVARKSEVDDNHATGQGLSSFMDQTVEPVSFQDTWENAFVRPAGLVWSTPSDQMKLARFLVQGDPSVLRDDLRALISTPHTPTSPDLPGDYGYGLSISEGFRINADYYETPMWSHGGNTITHTSTFYVLPEQEFAISILSNGLGDNFTASVVTAVSSLVELPPPGMEPEIVFDPDGLDALTGSYRDPYNLGRVMITRVGDALQVDMPDVTAAGVDYEPMLTPISTRVWRANFQGQDFVLQFFEGPGRTMYMANRAFVAKRTPDLVIGLTRPFVFSRERFEQAMQQQHLDVPSPNSLTWR